MNPFWIFDLDNTLYPPETGLFHLVDARIAEFMEVRLGLDPIEIPRLREQYWNTYGQTLGGLVAHFGVEPQEYLEFVHDVPVQEVLDPDPALAAALELLPGRKVIFTNGSQGHVSNVLRRLGVSSLMEAVFDIAFMDYQPKPRPHGYRKLLDTLQVAAEECWMIDDLSANLDTGLAMGMRTVLVGAATVAPHRWVRSAAELPQLFSRQGADRVD